MVSRNGFQFLTVILTLILIFSAGPGFARGNHDDHDRRSDHRYGHRWERHYSYHNHPGFGFRFSYIPDGSFSIRLGRERFYYNEGVYFRYYSGDYILVQPPIGAVVRRIPIDYRPVIINGITYYTDSGVYYVHTPSGYQVVPPPVSYVHVPTTIVQPVPVQAQVQPASQGPSTNVIMNDDETYTINIPNEKAGGYTEVTMKRSSKGFLGPQGEFYAEFPRVAQLKAMYGQ